MVETLADLGVGVDNDNGVHALRADDDVVEIPLVEDVEVLSSLVIMIASRYPCLWSLKTWRSSSSASVLSRAR